TGGDGNAVESSQRRAWLVRLQGDASSWLEEGYCGISTGVALGDIPDDTSRDGLFTRLREQDPDGSETSARMDAAVLDRFLNQMKPNDLLVTKYGQVIHG